MEEIARFGGLEHNAAIMLHAWEHIERILGDLYYRASQAVPSDEWKVLLRYIADSCIKHAEYIARIYYEAGFAEKISSPGELKEIAIESRRILSDASEAYEKASRSSDIEEIISAIEYIEEVGRIVSEVEETIGRLGGEGGGHAIPMLLRAIHGECNIRRDILKALKERASSR